MGASATVLENGPLVFDRFYLIPIGVVVGACGTLVGAGGGFVLVPLLLALYRDLEPSHITSISLAVVFVNACSGTIAYARQRRIDYRSGIAFAAATAPGAVSGAMVTHFLTRSTFHPLFGVALFALALTIFFSPQREITEQTRASSGSWKRHLTDSHHQSYDYSFNGWLGVGLSLLVGFVSSVLGIGGGIIHVPALVRLLNFPTHVATATSHFVLAFTALVGTMVHIASGQFHVGIRRTVLLAVGVAIGAQVGALYAPRIRSVFIMRLLALAIAFVGIRLMVWR